MKQKQTNKTNSLTNLHDIQLRLASFEDDLLPLLPCKETILERARQRKLKKRVRTGTALSLLGIFSGIFLLNPSYEQYEVRTQKGQQKSITLADGSQIILNTNTMLRVQQRIRSRQIHLLQGEANFTVKHIENKLLKPFERRFEVFAGDMHVIDIATVFNIDKHNKMDASVTVISGEVMAGIRNSKASMIHLTKNQSLRNYGQTLATVEQASLEQVQAWQTGHMVFNQTPLMSALQNFQRYSDFHVDIEDKELNDLPITGQFKTQSLQQFMQVLPYVAPLDIEQISTQKWKIKKKSAH